MDWCRAAGTEPMFCVNLGTRGPDEARRLLEYCNHPGGTALSDQRAAHGWPQPHGIRAWGLGNELDAHRRVPGWPEAPRLNEEVYTMEDALLVGGALVTLLNNCDRVRVACLAQLVNVIGAIMTETGGPAWRQTIFHPFAHAARLGRGHVLRAAVACPHATTRTAPEVPYLLAAVAQDADRLTLFAINRHPDEPMDLTLECRGFPGAGWQVVEAQELAHADRRAVNTRDVPDEVAPRTASRIEATGTGLRGVLPPASWTVVVLEQHR